MPVRGTERWVRQATAFAPGHLTGFFAPDLHARDPRGRGSVGAGLVLELGVTAVARWRPSRRPSVVLRSDLEGSLPISQDVAERLAARRPGHVEVSLRHDLPVGQGFGTSASGALSTALAVGTVVGAPRSTSVATAHLADLFGGGGLGGVSAILGGGLEVREEPGVPPFGKVRHLPFRSTVLIAVVGDPLLSPPLLRDPSFLERVRDAATDSLTALTRSRTPSTFLQESERFTDRLDVAPPPVRRTIHALRATGVRAAQAMFGQSVFAVAPNAAARRRALVVLARRRLSAIEIRAAAKGPISALWPARTFSNG